jgi:hypothetical protein
VLHIVRPVVEKPRLTQIELPFNAAPGFAVKLDAPDANNICHGWILEFDGADWAKARASFTNSRCTG